MPHWCIFNHFWITMGVYRPEEQVKSSFDNTENQFFIGFGLFVGFIKIPVKLLIHISYRILEQMFCVKNVTVKGSSHNLENTHIPLLSVSMDMYQTIYHLSLEKKVKKAYISHYSMSIYSSKQTGTFCVSTMKINRSTVPLIINMNLKWTWWVFIQCLQKSSSPASHALCTAKEAVHKV